MENMSRPIDEPRRFVRLTSVHVVARTPCHVNRAARWVLCSGRHFTPHRLRVAMVSIHVGWHSFVIDSVGCSKRLKSIAQKSNTRKCRRPRCCKYVVGVFVLYLNVSFGLILDEVLSDTIGLEVAPIL